MARIWFRASSRREKKTGSSGISKRGDVYLRFTADPRSPTAFRFRQVSRGKDPDGMAVARLIARRNINVAAVALANKNARIVWALVAHGRDYKSGYNSHQASGITA